MTAPAAHDETAPITLADQHRNGMHTQENQQAINAAAHDYNSRQSFMPEANGNSASRNFTENIMSTSSQHYGDGADSNRLDDGDSLMITSNVKNVRQLEIKQRL